MILSERELELGDDHTGIMVLDRGEPGAPLADVLQLGETILDLEPTGNRPDLLAVYGIAREVAALFDLELAIERPRARRDDRNLRDLPDHRVRRLHLHGLEIRRAAGQLA